MPRTPKFSFKKAPGTAARKDTKKWFVNVPATLTATGKRERHFYKTRDEAAAAAQTLREKFLEHGSNAAAIRPSLAEDATLAAALLEPWGASLLDAARAYVAAQEREGASVPLTTATAAFLLSCEGLRGRTIDGYRQTCAKLDATLGEKLLASVTAEDIAKAAELGNPGAAAANRFRCARAFWRWSAKRGWCDADTFAAVQSPRVSTEGEISVLTVAEATALLEVAEEHFPQAVASYALQLFAGIRVEEITRLEAEHVSATGIDLPASVAKKSRRRHITPSPTLSAWLKKHPFTPCSNWKEVNNACRRLAGWDVVSRLLDTPPEPTRGAWPQNVLRHSFASYAIAAGTPLEEMLFSFGHTGSPSLLRQHYLGRATKKDALEFFALRPGGETAEVQLEIVEGAA
jgi:site-specific recombinase XerD